MATKKNKGKAKPEAKAEAKAEAKVKGEVKVKVKAKPKGIQKNMTTWYWLGGILVATLLVYWPSFSNGFVWDDLVYIQENPLIYTINLSNIFSTYLAGNYHPLTVLVHAIEYQFFHFNTTGYHVVNVLIHLLNTSLVFYFIRRLTSNERIALVTALLFGLHPIHVESVAWVAELKDVLYTFFFLGALISYLHFSEKRNAGWYGLALGLFVLSALSKGMAVSFALVLVVIDIFQGKKFNGKVILEKIPFFVLSIVFGIIAIQAQVHETALHDDTIGWAQRIVFACYSYITYLQKLIFPFPLNAYYPYPVAPHEAIPVLYYVYPVMVLILAGYTFYALRHQKKIFFGIAFFTTTILLVLKLMPVGYALMADRYAYIPSIGIFYLAGEGLNWLWSNTTIQARKGISIALLAAGALFYGYSTFARSQVWKNEFTLWSDAIEKDPTMAIAYLNRAAYYTDEEKFQEAEVDLNKAIALNPAYADAFFNRGVVLERTGRPEPAMEDYTRTISIKPGYSKAYINRGNLYRNVQQYDAALADFNKGLELDPRQYVGYNGRGILYQNLNKNEEAIVNYTKAIEINPGYINAIVNRGNAYSALNNLTAALNDYNEAIRVNSQFGMAYNNRALVEIKMNDMTKACEDFRKAVEFGYANASQAIAQYCKN